MARTRRETRIISVCVCVCANFKELYTPYGSFLLLHHQKWGRMGPCWEAKNTQWAGSSLFFALTRLLVRYLRSESARSPERVVLWCLKTLALGSCRLLSDASCPSSSPG